MHLFCYSKATRANMTFGPHSVRYLTLFPPPLVVQVEIKGIPFSFWRNEGGLVGQPLTRVRCSCPD